MKKTGTITSSRMNGYGQASKQLYAQFLFRITNDFKGNSLSIFIPALFMAGESFKKVREDISKALDFKYGMMFQASHFADVKDSWGITFTVWKGKA